VPRRDTGAGHKLLVVVLAALVAGIVEILGLYAGVYGGRAKQINWWIGGSLSGALFVGAALAAYLALRASQLISLPSLSRPKVRVPAAIGGPVRRHTVGRPWRGQGKVPEQIPERLSKFCGRKAELAALLIAHGNVTSGRLGTPLTSALALLPRGHELRRGNPERPTIILIHGMPGVGKTAIAQEFGHMLAKRYPDGQLYANLGIGRKRRTPAYILQEFLQAFGISEAEMPDDEYERANLFRSLTTGKRVLIVLDAARGYDQVDLLLPTSPTCTVIITSRTSLGPELGALEYLLQVPGADDATEILRIYAGIPKEECIPEVARIVHYCGALPLALRSAGEQISTGRFTAEGLAGRLQPASARLVTLRYMARDIEDRISAEYERLPPRERRALQLLTLVESPTFGSWVLAPLMNVSTGETDSLAASLVRYHLLMDAGHAAKTGLPRYRLHELVSLVAEKRLNAEVPVEDQEMALRRLDSAYLEAARGILIRSQPNLAEIITWHAPSRWSSSEETWLPAVLANLEYWIGTEYRQILRAIRLANEEDAWSLSWRIAARLGSCVADGLRADESIRVFEAAQTAAELDDSARGRVEVLLAQGSFLAAVEHYNDALECLSQAIVRIDASIPPIPQREKYLLRMSAHRRRAEAWMQLGRYLDARQELSAAAGEAQAGDGSNSAFAQEAARVKLLMGENDAWLFPRNWFDRAPFDEARADPPDESIHFRATLGLAEHARRRRQWHDARRFFKEAEEANEHDARRVAAIRYRTARLVLQQGREGRSRDRARLAHDAARYVSEAVRIFHDMDNPVGRVRAKALLVRALLLAGWGNAANDVARMVDSEIHELEASDPASAPMQARAMRCRGEVMLSMREPDQARTLFVRAIEFFESDGDWRSAADTRVTLAGALARQGKLGLAQARLHEAEEVYSACGDEMSLASAMKQRMRLAHRERMRYWRNRL
jgi:tetratricopeptide (TPR) repeat protein